MAISPNGRKDCSDCAQVAAGLAGSWRCVERLAVRRFEGPAGRKGRRGRSESCLLRPSPLDQPSCGLPASEPLEGGVKPEVLRRARRRGGGGGCSPHGVLAGRKVPVERGWLEPLASS
ncbi:hypothetical protein NN561_008371 [Cricetulus griseus]